MAPKEGAKLATGIQLWTLALLIFVIIIPLLALYVVGSGLIDLDWPVAQVSTIVLVIALGFFSFVLVWGGERWGYVAAIITGIIIVLGIIGNLRVIAKGERPAGLVITNVSGLVFGVALVFAAFLGWLG